MVAGVITRLAPEAKIMPIRVLNGDGHGSLIDAVRGIRYAVANGAHVLNLSLGCTIRSSILDEAVREAQQAGCIIIAAAGNSGTTTVQYPAASPNVLSVAALDRGNVRASFSNYGGFVSLAAPGVAIRSTYVGGGYASWSGTSFATPFVSATAALTRSAHPDWTPDQVRRQVWQTATNVNSTTGGLTGLGKGVLNISRAIGLSVSAANRSQ
jgi:subtilisin